MTSPLIHSHIVTLIVVSFLLKLSASVLSSDDNNDLNTDDEELFQHQSCLYLDDGEHYIRPKVSDSNDNSLLPSIRVKCKAGWTILDYSLDPNIALYFSSLMIVHDNFATMDVSIEHLNWDEWFKVNNVIYATSEDCNTCNDESNAGYYMTGNYYGCAFATKALCDMDPITLDCYTCPIHDTSGDDDLHPGLCAHIELDINNQMVDSKLTPHDKCVTYKWNYLPSLGTTGRFCTCFKPDESLLTTGDTDDIMDALFDESDADALNTDDEDDKEDIYDSSCITPTDKVYELYNTDFASGTYRIRKCGTYKLMEDIELNMNSPLNMDYDISSVNNPNDLHWYPSSIQTDNENEYPSHNFIGAFSMGFFAGISVENDNIIINLNGYELRMHQDFYLQQRFFSLIELGSKPFISGQGPSNFGNINVHFASNIIIENGVLGLTSHHCIHGNNNNDIQIRNIHMKDFEVSALSLNGFDGVSLHDVEVGPNYQNIPLTSMYTHARFMIQRLDYIPDRDDKHVIIGNKKVAANNIVYNLREEMNEAFVFAHENIDAGMQIEDLIENNFGDNLFINFDGLPHGGTLYGMFFNSFGAGVFGLGLAPGKSNNLRLKDINIHDLRSNPVETIRYKLNRGPFNDLLDIEKIVASDGSYHGTSYSDAQYTLHKLIPDTMWSVLGHTYINNEIDEWIQNDNKFNLFSTMDDDTPTIKCNSDVMVHLTKGIFGIRIDNVNNLDISGDIRIGNLHNLGNLGEDELCGNYYSSKDGGHDDQVYPLQIGFTGNEVHGISFIGSQGIINNNVNIEIQDFVSARGSVYGINFYPNNDITIHKDAQMNIMDIHSGIYLEMNDNNPHKFQLPNTLPRSCAIDIWNNDYNDNEYNTKIRFHDGVHHKINKITHINEKNFQAKCITQHDQCSFDYSNIDKSFKNNKYLNIDLLNDLVDNTECELIDNSNQFIGLKESSNINVNHQKTFNLLKIQDRILNNGGDSPQDKIEHVLNINSAFQFELYLVVILFVIIITCIVAVWKCIKTKQFRKRRKSKHVKGNIKYIPITSRTPLFLIKDNGNKHTSTCKQHKQHEEEEYIK